jgi:molecular chaperone DnaK
MGLAVGIDLGTTYTAVACVDEYGKPIIVRNFEGQGTTPSVVFFDPPNYVIGDVALQSTFTEPDRVVQFVKRRIGYKDQRVHVAGHSYSPEFVSSLILRKVISEAQESLGQIIDRAVITVPAYFTETQRHATHVAGQMAGLEVLRIINEPTAAALAYGLSECSASTSCNVLVYDLGGGTFDVTVLHIDKESVQVLAIGGDAHLGGKDFDDRIINFFEEELLQKYNIELEDDQCFEAELRLKAESAKRQLSARSSVPISLRVPRSASTSSATSERMVPVRLDLTRDKFADITADLMMRTELLLEKVMTQAKIGWDDISEVLCVGGSSRMPMVREMLSRITKSRLRIYDPDECVAKGAAMQAALITKENLLTEYSDIKVGHVLAHSLGVAVNRNGKLIIDHVIPNLTPLPCIHRRANYTTSQDNQTNVLVHVYEGESDDPDAYASGPIATLQLDASPPRPKGKPRFSVEFHCNENGRMTAVARDESTHKEIRANIHRNGIRSNSEADLEADMLAEAIVS